MSRKTKKIYLKIKKIFQNERTVDFIICGTQKGGTSALDAYLREHPEICMADKKEVHYFDKEKHFSSGKPDYSEYHTFFRPRKSHKILGEATPLYMYWKDVPRRIWEYNSNMKIIVILRNPIERAYSHWNMTRTKNSEDLSFWDAIKKENERCSNALPRQHRKYSYIDRGFYLVQLRRIWSYFPKERVLVIKNEDLKQKPQDTLDNLCEFLEINKFKDVVPKNVHSRPYVSSMSKKEKDYLKSIFEHEIKELEIELNWNCSRWLDC
jgi:hypothetical protein